ncbi:helix-turn-helix domain-containing protein [Haloactinopolyspora sp.]|uniref:helix-turn-helix domain-containing protein n=1 Tax=Haloactinopolyspora sp. TaxID=1966353 RepID=UPI002621C105|nr:helix-turn-helix domain-containing protein [Haloactinopolyspora sp.]
MQGGDDAGDLSDHDRRGLLMLTVLGASPDEDRVYGHLVTTMSATEAEIAQATDLSPAAIRTALAALAGRGLVSTTGDVPPRFVAASPGVVESMIAERLRELREAQDALDRLSAHHRATSLAMDASGVFEIVRGQEALRQCTMNLFASARHEVLNLIKPPAIVVESEERVQAHPSARGRAVFETEALENPGSLAAVQEGLRDGDLVRVHTKLPIKMLAIDRSIALLPLAQRDSTPVGVLIRQGAVLDALLELFEFVWAAAVPLHVDSEHTPPARNNSVLGDDDRRLLSLLLSGLTDEAIAAHRGTSVRTVQRRVHALMDLAHVRTRMQLAWEAARQGWV